MSVFCHLPDFLPLKCDACGEVFCKDHIRYDDHSCSSAYKKVSARTHGTECHCRVTESHREAALRLDLWFL